MAKIILTQSYNGDYCTVVELPEPFVVHVAYDNDGHVTVDFSSPEDAIDEYLFKFNLFVPEKYHDVAEYVDEHTVFTNFRKLIMDYIVEDIIEYMRTGYYYDDDEDACQDFEPYKSFNLDHYTDRWEKFIEEYLENPDKHFS